MPRALALIGSVALVLTLVACEGGTVFEEESISQSFMTGPSPLVIVDTFAGDITIVGRRDGLVDATFIRRGAGDNDDEAFDDLGRVEVRFSQDGDTIRLTATHARGASRPPGSRASVRIFLPAGARLELATGNGNVITEQMSGPQVIETANGTVRIDGASGELDIDSKNGAISINGSPVRVQVRTSNGNLDFEGALAEGESEFRTANGNITLRLPAEAAFLLDASTINGNVTSTFDVRGASRAARTHLSGTVGDDPVTILQLRTNNGNIRIR
jgi:hypothetical protein